MQPDLTEKILELIRRTSSDLPADVEERLRAAVDKEVREPGRGEETEAEVALPIANRQLPIGNSQPGAGSASFSISSPGSAHGDDSTGLAS